MMTSGCKMHNPHTDLADSKLSINSPSKRTFTNIYIWGRETYHLPKISNEEKVMSSTQDQENFHDWNSLSRDWKGSYIPSSRDTEKSAFQVEEEQSPGGEISICNGEEMQLESGILYRKPGVGKLAVTHHMDKVLQQISMEIKTGVRQWRSF